MFVSFSVSNFGPFPGTVGINTICDTTKKEFLEDNTFSVGTKRYNRVTYVYGFNGSGKSNIFKALLTMKQMLALSPIIATNNQQILDSVNIKDEVNAPRNFFKFNDSHKDKPTVFAIEFIIDEVLYSYSFEVLNKKIASEILSKKSKRREIILNRTSADYNDIVLKGEFSSFDQNKNVVKEDVLCLSMAMFLNNALANKIYKEIDDIIVMNMAAFSGFQITDEDITEESLNQYTKFLKLADSTIKEIKISLKKDEINSKIKLGSDFESREFVVQKIQVAVDSIHSIYKDRKVVGDLKLPFLQYESNGTVKMFGILPAIFRTLENGGVLFVDEIENGLHPNLTKKIVDLFNSKNSNPKNAQLICTSHETLLLNGDIRRDQVWFLHKNNYGESKIERLSEFPNIRISDNIAKKYLNDAFGKIPNME